MQMKPGRDLDAVVAEHVMGWVKGPRGFWATPEKLDGLYGVGYTYGGGDHEFDDFSPSEMDTMALEVIRELERRKLIVVMSNTRKPGLATTGWSVSVLMYNPKFPGSVKGARPIAGQDCDTLSHAVCLAALQAVAALKKGARFFR